jgi:excisionase family DNA binding protein
VPRLTVSQAAEYVPCGVSTLNKLRVSGGGPRFIKLGGRILYDVRDIDKWMDENKHDSTSDLGRRAA